MSSGTIIFVLLIATVTVMGFAAARWRPGNLANLDEWALGGRGFGTLVSWFLLGGDLYTAYTFIAVPALVYGAGALGFFAVPYTTIAYPFVFVVMARFWVVAKNRGYVTVADFVRDRFGDRWLEVAVALTGVLAAMPYIALQLVGMQVIFAEIGGAQAVVFEQIALILAFAILAAYTYTSGLRAPAMIAFVKDALLYVTIIAAIVIIPAKLGGWAHIFSTAALSLKAHKPPGSLVIAPHQYFAYAALAFGSAMSLFLYPHSITSLLSAKSKRVIQRNSALLPLYSILLALLALLGYCALAAGINVPAPYNLAIPRLFERFFPDWFVGVAFAAIVIGALVPAAIMAIGSANLFVSNVLREFSPRRPAAETQQAKWLCLAICAAALAFVLLVPVPYAINFQLLGGGWMLQVFPSTALALYTRWFHPKALLAGWACGMIAATWMAIAVNYKTLFPLPLPGGGTLIGFIAFYAVVVNFAVSIALTPIFNGLRFARGVDCTAAADYA
ncbi:MAG: sodium:solute symporter [Candidatus Meridianibacter frigidus]|nr:MAG: sodium:solute symporter [Candidatus Eremiobacteraeota bacterium]